MGMVKLPKEITLVILFFITSILTVILDNSEYAVFHFLGFLGVFAILSLFSKQLPNILVISLMIVTCYLCVILYSTIMVVIILALYCIINGLIIGKFNEQINDNLVNVSIIYTMLLIIVVIITLVLQSSCKTWVMA